MLFFKINASDNKVVKILFYYVLILLSPHFLTLDVFKTMKSLLTKIFSIAILSIAAIGANAETINVYVAPNGNDSWSGTSFDSQAPDGPFLTIVRAQEEARLLIQRNPSDKVIVNIKGGSYYITHPIYFNQEDSGTPSNPLTFRAYNNEEVIISGGIELVGFSEADGNAGINPIAAGKLLHINLNTAGITDYGSLLTRDDKMDLLFNNQPMTLARWPNTSQAIVTSVPVNQPLPDNEGDKVGQIGFGHNRAQYWINEPALLTQGYWFNNWANEIHQVVNIDLINNIMHLAEPFHRYGYRAGQRYFVANALYELDSPGEWYLNRDSGDLYFWPPENEATNPVIQLSSIQNLMVFNNASWIVIEGIQFSGSRGSAIQITDGAYVHIKKCTIRNSGSTAINLNNGQGHSITGCDISNTGEGGIVLNGGDRDSLTPSNHMAENNYIHNFSRLFRTNAPAILLEGVGAIAKNNTIHNGPDTALVLNGNNHIVEYNEIFDVTYETEGSGAINSQRDLTARGNIIQNNYLHHITGFNGKLNAAVLLNDQASGFTIKSNLFFNNNYGVYIGGGSDNVIEGNTFILTDTSVQIDDRELISQNASSPIGQELQANLDAVPYTSPVWSANYPTLKNIIENSFSAINNVIVNNLSNSVFRFNISETVSESTEVSNNQVLNDMQISLSNGSISNISLQTIDLLALGVYRNKDRAEWPIEKYRRVETTDRVPTPIDITPQPQETDLLVTGSGNRTRLTWKGPTNYEDIDAYRIERRISGGSWSVVESNYMFAHNPLPYIYYDDFDLIIGQEYEYRVAYILNGVLSDYSNVDSVLLTGTIYYISSTGSNINSGTTPDQPWPVNKLYMNYEPGDLVLFKRGDTLSFEGLYLTGLGDGTVKNPIRWDSYGLGNLPVLIGSGKKSLSFRDMSNWVISNIHVTGASSQVSHVLAQSKDVSNFKFLNVYIDGSSVTANSFGAGIHIDEQGRSNQKTSLFFIDNVEVAYSTIVNVANGVGNNDGVRLIATRSNGHVHNNIFNGNGGEAVDIAGGKNHVVEYNLMKCGEYNAPLGSGSKVHGQQHRLENAVYRGNLIYYCNGFGLSIGDSKNGLVENNTVFLGEHGYAGLSHSATWQPEDHYGNIIRNNIFMGARGNEGVMRFALSDINDNGETFGGVGDNWFEQFDAQNNLYFNSGKNIIRFYDDYRSTDGFVISTSQFSAQWSIYYPTDIVGDPLFVDPANADFRIQESSPAKGIGVPDFMFNMHSSQ